MTPVALLLAILPPLAAGSAYINEFHTECDPGAYYTVPQAQCLPCPAGRFTGPAERDSVVAELSVVAYSTTDGACSGDLSLVFSDDGWCFGAGAGGSTPPFLVVDMAVDTVMTGTVTKGRKGSDEWVTAYSLRYLPDSAGPPSAASWNASAAVDGGAQFAGNANADGSFLHLFAAPITGRYVRLEAAGYHTRYSLRWGLIMSNPVGAPCVPNTFSLAGASVCAPCAPGTNSSAGASACAITTTPTPTPATTPPPRVDGASPLVPVAIAAGAVAVVGVAAVALFTVNRRVTAPAARRGPELPYKLERPQPNLNE
jgi:hypothetical protein